MPGLEARRIALAGLLFLLSGAAGLVYQVAWQRILALHSGVGIYSIAMIVAAFMAGLGAGSHLGGAAQPARSTPRRALRTFALVELGIGVFGAPAAGSTTTCSTARLPGSTPRPGAPASCTSPRSRCPRADGHVAAVPGARDGGRARTAGRTIGVLYGINLLGAAAGALLTPWVLIRLYGIRGAVSWAAARQRWPPASRRRSCSRAGRAPGAAGAGAADAARAAAASGRRSRSRLWMALYALSRVLRALPRDPVVPPAGRGGEGDRVHVRDDARALPPGLGRRAAWPARRSSRACAGRCAPSCSASALLLVLRGRRRVPARPACRRSARSTPGTVATGSTAGGFNLGARARTRGAVARLYVLLPLLLYGPPTVLMGFAFPVLQRAVQDDPRTSGRKVGLLQAANIAGCVAGSLLVGLLALAWLGTTGTLRAADGGGRSSSRRSGCAASAPRSAFAPLAVALVALAVAAAGPARALAAPARHQAPARARRRGRDRRGRDPAAAGGRLERAVVNGKSHSWLPFGGIHSALGAAARRSCTPRRTTSPSSAWAPATPPGRPAAGRRRARSPCSRSPGRSRACCARCAAREDLPDLRGFLADPRVRDRGRGRPQRARRERAPLRRDRGRRAVARGLVRGQPVLGASSSRSARAAEAGRRHVHLGAHAARLRRLHPQRVPHVVGGPARS